MTIDSTAMNCKACYAPLPILDQRSNIIRCPYCNTENVLSKEVRVVIAEDTHAFRVRLMRAMFPLFSLNDMKQLITIMSGHVRYGTYLDYDNIPGETAVDKTRELVLWSTRHSTMQILVDCVLSMRPDIDLT